MTTLLDILSNLLFLVIGLFLGYFLNKQQLKEKLKEVGAILVKPNGTVIDSKEENSLNKITDDSNMHHNDYFDEPNEIR